MEPTLEIQILVKAGKMTKRKSVKFSRIDLFSKFVVHFINNIWAFLSTISSLHGSKHLESRKDKLRGPRKYVRKIDAILGTVLKSVYFFSIFWTIVLLSASVLMIYVQKLFLQRYFERPLVTSLERDYYTWNTTFPSFTLCSQRKINETALKLYLSEMISPQRDIVELEAFLRILVNLTMYNLDTLSKFENASFQNLHYMRAIERLTNKYDYDVLIDSVPRFKLQRTITELGICDQFNSELSRIFTTDFLISEKTVAPEKSQLFEVNYFDANPHIVLNDLDDSNIHLHGPYELPQILQKREISGSASQYKSFSLTATTIVARKNVRSLFVSHRKCRYFDESNLVRFPSIYTYDLCKLECRINAIVDRCNCVPFFYKKLPNEIYCSIKKLLCVELHMDDINEAAKSCECYQTCTNVRFGIQGVNSLNWLQNNKLRVELNKPKMRLVREALHSFTDVVAAIGATFCLFLGTSLLTSVEITYYVCLRRIIKRREIFKIRKI